MMMYSIDNCISELQILRDDSQNEIDQQLSKLKKEGLGRTAYLKKKYNIRHKGSGGIAPFCRGEISAVDLKVLEEAVSPSSLPESIKRYYLFTDGFEGEPYQFPFYIPRANILANDHKKLVDSFVGFEFPQLYSRFLNFSYYHQKSICIFMYDNDQLSGDVVLHDLEDREIYLVASSFENLLARGINCIKNDMKMNLFRPRKEDIEFVESIESEPVLPIKEKGITQFSFDRIDEFPERWKQYATKEDLEFDLAGEWD